MSDRPDPALTRHRLLKAALGPALPWTPPLEVLDEADLGAEAITTLGRALGTLAGDVATLIRLDMANYRIVDELLDAFTHHLANHCALPDPEFDATVHLYADAITATIKAAEVAP